jgi:hypothetical protein
MKGLELFVQPERGPRAIPFGIGIHCGGPQGQEEQAPAPASKLARLCIQAQARPHYRHVGGVTRQTARMPSLTI